MKIACDVGVSNKTIEFLKKEGFDVVYKADHNTPDEIWFYEALDLGADVFVSSDIDIAILVDREYECNLSWVDVQNKPYKEANGFLLKRLNKLKARYS